MAHLGHRVSALLDGQLGTDEEERAWAHVHECHACRDLVEREGWVKTRLLGLSLEHQAAPTHLKGALVDPTVCADRVRPPQSHRGIVVVGGGALGAAVLGILALTVPPGTTAAERRPPAATVSSPGVGDSLSAVTGGTTSTVSTGVAVDPVGYRVAPHHGRAGVSGVRMLP